MKWFRFRQDNLVVDGGQVVPLVFVHGRGSPFDIDGLLHFLSQISQMS